MGINLENFEYDFISKRTPDVLSSPRSLEACAKLFIQPIELVYKTLEEYEEVLGDLPLSDIYRIYEAEETERQTKLLKCRELRKRMISEAIWKQSARRGVSAMMEHERRKRIPDFGGSDSEVNYGSDTESHEDNWGNGESEEQQRPQSRQTKQTLKVSPFSPKYKSKSNADFKKLISSPRPHQLCSCQITANLDDDEIVNEYMQRYGGMIASRNDLSRDDKKILELLIRRKGKDAEWGKKSEELRKAIEDDKISYCRKNQLRSVNWAERLAEKRHLENIDNTNRFLALEVEARDRRLNLLKYLEVRDAKVQEYLEQLQYQKRQHLVDRHNQEALRQLEVGKAIDRILEADKQHRQDLAEKLQQRMVDSELRRKRKEVDNLRHITEMNRLEEVKRELKQERLEQESRQCTDALRNQIEDKEHRATMNYLANLRLRNTLLSQGAGNRNFTIEKTRKVHSELLRGLEEWNKKVYELHLAAQERATLNHFAEINRRRARVATERILREERSIEIQKRVKETEEQRMELMKTVIESKDFRSARIKEQKEQQIYVSRLRAQHGAELRGALKEKLDPETFDRKAARAEIEFRLLRKYPPKPAVRFTNQIPKVNIGRHLHCRCGCGKIPELRNRIVPMPHLCRPK